MSQFERSLWLKAIRNGGIPRKTFGKIRDVVSLPNLIEVQSKSFNDFVQLDYLSSERRNIGLEKILRDTFPIAHGDKVSLEYVSYELGEWQCICGGLTGLASRYSWACHSCKKEGLCSLKNKGACPHCKKNAAQYIHCKKCFSRPTIKIPISVNECRYSGRTFSFPLKVKMRLVIWDQDLQTGVKTVRNIKEQDVFFCDLPIMIDLYEDASGRIQTGSQGTFLVNGVDRVVVSQMHRSPGVIFSLSKKTKDFRGNPYHIARIIPNRGSWLDFEFDHNDLLYVRIDKKKKILVTTFLQAMGIPRKDILPAFYDLDKITIKHGSLSREVDKSLIGKRLEHKLVSPEHAEAFPIGKRLTKADVEKLQKLGVALLEVPVSSLLNKVVGLDVLDPETGEVLIGQGAVLTQELIDSLLDLPSGEVHIIRHAGYILQPTISLTFAQDNVETYEEALKDVYGKLKPGDLPTIKSMEEHIHNLFFNPRFYDLTLVGRIRTNRKLGLAISEEITHLTKEDIMATLKYLVGLKERGEGELDDIDHLGNRCVRLVGELLQAQLYVGFARIDRIVRERFRLQENCGVLMPYDFLNVKPLAAVMREFFGTGQLSQFMDQTNPLSEMAHKRRLSALGPGGLTRERATFEVRDVHTSHYGRICPIETPEGQNIGLISSLSTYARVNDLGFIETPYRRVTDYKVSDEVEYLDAFEEQGKNIAQSGTIDKEGRIAKDTQILVRRGCGDIAPVVSSDVNYVDASPRQLFSVATALIPFLEHDDANRALMGSNMQRQAVPLIRCEVPLVGTGIESETGTSEGAVILAKNPGIVTYVSSTKIVVQLDDASDVAGLASQASLVNSVDIYSLKKFARSSHNTWIHHSPAVKTGARIERGDVLTTGPAVQDGELSLGSNVLVAFMPWLGYNFEDAVVVSKRLVSDDVFTSVHVEEFVVEARDTKLGAEEITRDIPNVSERDLEVLDDDGIIKVGARVKPGDILVGKVTLKGDVQVSPEEKLLRAVFGEKSREVRDTSLRVPPGVEATVVDVKVFSRSGIRKDKRYKDIVQKESTKIEENLAYQTSALQETTKRKAIELIAGKHPKEAAKYKELIKDKVFDRACLQDLSLDVLVELLTTDTDVNAQLKQYKNVLASQQHILTALKEEQISRLRKGDELPSGVIKMIKVYVATRRHLSVGDKVAGRHGNKGVVSRIVNREDMPYMEDGTPVDMVLNPLGVPGRMNIGQILETMLGMAGKKLGEQLGSQLAAMSQKAVEDWLISYYGNDVVATIKNAYGPEKLMDIARRIADKGLPAMTRLFDGADCDLDIKPLLRQANLPESGSFTLYDGRTGESFEQKVTVGFIYMMKLNHLADDKLHARSVGPYSLITQQPLGGKAQFGGQRLGEMEVWALYAYGAAYTLQEMLTIKSDDVSGRIKAYEAIVRGDEVPDPGIPESFNVLIRELQSLGLQVDLFKTSKEQIGE